MKTAQEIFTQVKTHLLTQNAKALNHGTCRYRSDQSGVILKCAIGCLIPDEAYSSSFEGACVEDDMMDRPLHAAGIDIDNEEIMAILTKLQSIHDCQPVSCWERDLRRLAAIYDLVY